MKFNFLAPVMAMARGSKPPASTTSTTSLTPPGTPPTATQREAILAEVRSCFTPAWSPTPDESLVAICRALPQLVTDDELVELKRLNAEYIRGQEHLAQLGKDKIREAHAQHVAEVGERALRGEEVPDAFSREDIAEDLAARRQGLKRAIGSRGLAAARIVANIARRFIEAGTKHVEDLAVTDYLAYATYGVPYTPNTLIKTLLSAIERAKTVAGAVDKFEELALHGAMLNSPATQCAPFGITLERPNLPDTSEETRLARKQESIEKAQKARSVATAASDADRKAAEHKAGLEAKAARNAETLRELGREDMISKAP